MWILRCVYCSEIENQATLSCLPEPKAGLKYLGWRKSDVYISCEGEREAGGERGRRRERQKSERGRRERGGRAKEREPAARERQERDRRRERHERERHERE
jgi:hypothetical protein